MILNRESKFVKNRLVFCWAFALEQLCIWIYLFEQECRFESSGSFVPSDHPFRIRFCWNDCSWFLWVWIKINIVTNCVFSDVRCAKFYLFVNDGRCSRLRSQQTNQCCIFAAFGSPFASLSGAPSASAFSLLALFVFFSRLVRRGRPPLCGRRRRLCVKVLTFVARLACTIRHKFAWWRMLESTIGSFVALPFHVETAILFLLRR